MTTAENEENDTGTPSDLLPVVGIGASAGGLAALKELFGHMPADTGLAFVVVVHLSPKHESHLPDLLQPRTQMPVMQVGETVGMEANHVYVIPPGCNLTAVDTHLRLSDLEEDRSQRAPIDHFFKTLAETHPATAIGVVLTGTGSDGTFGLRRIREQGGLTIAQDPAEAEYDSMPRSAISSGVVDQVLPLSEMPDHIISFATTGPIVPVSDEDGALERDAQQTVREILTSVRTHTGHDFTRYKPATVLRRIHRRMQLKRIEDLGEYAECVDRDCEEARRFFDDLLITVTNFFRDPETFAVLERDLIPTLFEGKTEQDRVRAWSVGCSTGEEAYSLAILLLEHASRLDHPPTIQVFATDLHDASLQKAREGLYSDAIEADVSPERLGRFFLRENDYYRVLPAVREAVVFAPHNVMEDPPFSQLDLISCRNMLIYLEADAQQRITSRFHYALRPGGCLLLGSSETVEHSELFERTNKSHPIFRRREVPAHKPRPPAFSMPSTRFDRREPGVPGRFGGAPGSGALHQKMVQRHAPPSILVNEDHALLHSSGPVGRYLTVPSGEPTNDVFRLVREPLRPELRAGLVAGRDQKENYRSKPIRLEVGGETSHVIMRVQPAGADELANLYLVIFDEVRAADSEEPDEEGETQDIVQELAATRAHLQAVVGDRDAREEEMQASNEELQSMNEELRSTMEELETSKEELQSMNEELATINQESRHRVEELAQLSSDLQNLMSATDIATLFLDRQLRIMRFTPPLTELFNVRPADRGRPISDLTHRLGDIALEADAQQVLDSLVPLTQEVRSEGGRWFLTRMLPYRSTEDRIEGVVITFVDITERKEAEEALKDAKVYSESIVETLHEPLLILTPDLFVQTVNEAFYEHFEVDRNATLGRRIYDLGNGQWDIPDLRRLLEEVLPDNEVFNDYEVRHEFDDIGERVMLVNARRLDHVQRIMVGIRDITEYQEALVAARESEARLMAEAQALARLNELSEGLWLALGLEEGLGEMLGGTISLLGGDKGNIQLLDDGRFRIVAQRGFDQDFIDFFDGMHPNDDAACGRAARTLEVTVIEDVRTDESYAPLRTTAESAGYRAVTSVPVIGSAGTVLGVLSVHFGAPHRPSDQELDRLRLSGRLAASFIERQRVTVPLRELGRTLMMAEQEERRRIGQFLHDDLQQLLFGIQLRLESLTDAFWALDRPELSKDLREVLRWIGNAIASTRELSVDLVPPVLRGEGLAEALEWLATRMADTHQLEVTLHVEYEGPLGGENRDVLLYQIARELLFNVVKHAEVLEATVSLRREGDSIQLEVSDDGVGFDLEKVGRSRSRRTGLGLFSVRERIHLAGGEAEFDTAPGQGTRIRITAPFGKASDQVLDPKEAP
ncbi:MAG: chemotaxis protein CheB [Gemmatimonadota bacterium]